ncbi:26S protease regulatory subunit [Curtobacterium sp. MCBA15_004]|uniref:ATP-binding protein n=1 Tax=unclassified Curtobacterium TaxID=257496 RepID=UPI0008DD81DD|nr:ATP-binding protein [Curtobacterium sp. MCBA15_004]WIA95324.1 ATP-binding protein [Curtobacterium sp. MCBA15_004]
MTDDALFSSLFAAVAAAPDDVGLRGQVAQLLLDRGRPAEALQHAAVALQHAPRDATALRVLTAASAALRGSAAGDAVPTPERGTDGGVRPHADAAPEATGDRSTAADGDHPADAGGPGTGTAPPGRAGDDFDWRRAEAELGHVVPPPFVDATPTSDRSTADGDGDRPERIRVDGGDGEPVVDVEVERPQVTLADVGGLEDVKQRIRESFLEPMRHPELAAAFGKTLRGGLVLYGPPGCGKTFMARAIAGELGAHFLTVRIDQVLDPYVGATEKNLHAVFEAARAKAPAVLFLDEIDALGARRSSIGTGWSGLRQMVNQLLLELDSVGSDNDGLFVLAATNSPWDVDPALLRPGRFDRMTLVLPPDAPAREAILRHHFARRPIAGIDLAEVVAATEDFSGADLEHLVTSAAEQAMARSVAAGRIEPVVMDDVLRARSQVQPSTGSWLVTAKNVAAFANADGRYDDLVAYLRRKRVL